MGQRTAIIVQHYDKEANKKNTRVFYHQWGIGRILPSQLISVLNATLSTSASNEDFLERLQPQGTRDMTAYVRDLFDHCELNFDTPDRIGEVLQSVDNNNGGIFVRITTNKTRGIDDIEYAYMLGYDDGGNYRNFCTEEEWFEKDGYGYIFQPFKDYYYAAIHYFGAEQRNKGERK